MGGASSYVRHVSKPGDAVPNLVWALQTLVEWEESCRFLKLDMAGENKELGAKFLFVHSLLEQLVSLSVDVLKLKTRLDNWTEKPASTASPREKYQRQQDINSKTDRLLESLRAYDNARSACQWLRHDFTIVRQMAELREHMADAQEPELSKLESEMVKLTDSREEHHRRMLEVSLHYIDRNAPYGSVDPEDMPSLSAHLFNMLDSNSKHQITTHSLRTTLTNLDNKIIKSEELIWKLTEEIAVLQEKHGSLEQDVEAFGPAETKQQVKKKREVQNKFDQAYVDLISLQDKLEKAETLLTKEKEDKTKIFATFSTAFVEDMTKKLEMLEKTDVSSALAVVFARTVEMKDLAIGTADTDIKIGAVYREGEEEVKVPEGERAPLPPLPPSPPSPGREVVKAEEKVVAEKVKEEMPVGWEKEKEEVEVAPEEKLEGEEAPKLSPGEVKLSPGEEKGGPGGEKAGPGEEKAAVFGSPPKAPPLGSPPKKAGGEEKGAGDTPYPPVLGELEEKEEQQMLQV